MSNGLNITLFRRFSDTIHDDSFDADFIVFGNFDTMDISPIESLNDFSPVVLNKHLWDSQNKFFDKYYIKLIHIPSLDMNRAGFDYHFWENLNLPAEDRNLFYGFLLLSFSKEVVQQYPSAEKLQKYLSDILQNCLKNAYNRQMYNDITNLLSSFHFAIYPMLGYFDLALLFNTNNLSKILDIVNQLKTHPDIFNSSLIIAQKSQESSADFTLKNSEDENVCLSIKLKTKSNANHKKCVNILHKHFSESEITETIDYVYDGNSDLLIFDVPIFKVYKDFYSNGFFNPTSSFMSNNVRRINSTISLKACNTNTNNCKRQEGHNRSMLNDNNSEYISKFVDFLKNYRREQNRHYLSGRIVSGWMELINLYEESTIYPYTFDIKNILNHFFYTTLFCIQKSLQLINDSYTDDLEDCFYYENLIKDFETAVSSIRNCLSEYIKSISFSDLHLTDGSQLPHPAGVFTTKFLFAYNRIVTKYTNFIIQNDAETAYTSNYSFLVVSGNGDETTIEDCFYFLNNEFNPNTNLLDERKPFIIRIPEKSLYSIQTTMIHLFHECMHNCGNRLRNERINDMTKFVCFQITHNIVEFAFPSVFKIRSVLSSARLMIDNESEFIKELKSLRDRTMKLLESKFRDYLIESAIKEVKKRAILPSNMLLSQSYNIILDCIKKILYNRRYCKESFFCYSYQSILESELKLMIEIKEKYFDTVYTPIDYFISSLLYYIDIEDKYEDLELYSYLSQIFDTLLENEQPLYDVMDEAEDLECSIIMDLEMNFSIYDSFKNSVSQIVETIKKGKLYLTDEEIFDQLIKIERTDEQAIKSIFSQLCYYQQIKANENILSSIIANNSIYNIVGLAIDVFKECYADITSIIALDVKLEQFIVSFVLDNENAKIIFSKDDLNTMRIGSIMRNCYGIYSLTDLMESQDVIKSELTRYPLLDVDNFDVLWDALVSLFIEYSYESDYYQPLDEYLSKIRDVFLGYDFQNIKEIKLFYKLLSQKEQPAEIVDYLYKFWSELANG